MNITSVRKFYFVDNGPRNFMDCFDGMRPALGGVFVTCAIGVQVHERETPFVIYGLWRSCCCRGLL